FALREGVVFSNGSALTASDVRFTFERLLKAAKDNTDIPLEVQGGEAVMKGEADSLEGFSITDDTHFSITLTAPNMGFPAELSAPAASIVDAESMSSGLHAALCRTGSVGSSAMARGTAQPVISLRRAHSAKSSASVGRPSAALTARPNLNGLAVDATTQGRLSPVSAR
ncbi:MAG: hypothetical protein IKS52_13070, partial [Clostridia bacterium]|nr:hypothetical protein [Clostridia bacterium]